MGLTFLLEGGNEGAVRVQGWPNGMLACYIPAAPGAAGYPPAAICPVFFDMPHKDNP